MSCAIEKMVANPKGFPYDDYHATMSRLEEIEFHGFYSEPGYTDPEGPGIVIGNANDTFRPDEKKFPYGSKERQAEDAKAKKHSMIRRVFRALDRVGYEFEWCDEWLACEECRGLVRTSPDSYGWQKYFYMPDDCSCICGDCVKGDETETERYLEWLEGNEKRADMFHLDLAKLGYVLVQDDFEHGFHHGQDADPKLIAKAIRDAGGTRFIFVMDSVGQFDFKFSVWIHKEQEHITNKVRLTPDVVDGPSVSGAMQRGLQQSSLINASMPNIPGTVRYTKIVGDTAKGTLIPGDEFIEHGVKKAEERLDNAS